MGGISARKTKNDAWSVYILCVVRARTWGRREVNGWIGLSVGEDRVLERIERWTG